MKRASDRDYPEMIDSVKVDLVQVGKTVFLTLDCLDYQTAEDMYDRVRETLFQVEKRKK